MILIGSQAVDFRLRRHRYYELSPQKDIDLIAHDFEIETLLEQLKLSKAHFNYKTRKGNTHTAHCIVVNPNEIYKKYRFDIREADNGKSDDYLLNMDIHDGNFFQEDSIPFYIELIHKEDSEGGFVETQMFHVDTCLLATPALVYALKLSHRFRKNSVHFEKTRQHIMELRRRNDTHLDAHLKWFSAWREKETLDYGHPVLKDTSKEEFFRDNYKYDHDSLHQAVKIGNTPAYELYSKDDGNGTGTVDCDKDLFFSCPEEVRINGVREEAAVLALERSQIPFDYIPRPEKSYEIAIKKVCTSITSGWFREFAWDNYDIVKEPYDYMNKFHTAVENGTVKLNPDYESNITNKIN